MLHIFTRDLRISDNNSLNLLENVIPIFIFTPEQVSQNSYKSDNAVQFMVESLKDLNKQLNGKLGLFYGEFDKVIKNIIKTSKINTISITKDYTPYAKKREQILKKICDDNNIKLTITEDYFLTDKIDNIKLYKKYTPYKNISEKIKIAPIKTKRLTFTKIKGNYDFTKAQKLYKENSNINLRGGRENGLKQLSRITKHGLYSKERNNLSKKTTEMSAYLKFGCISIREMYWMVKKLSVSKDLIAQLIWRDFYFQLSKTIVKLENPLKEKYSKIKWSNNKSHFEAWKNGKTGFPIVDAGMRQLNSTGFMHNRARLITASFLVKTLLIDWRWGEKYYATKLYDYDPLVNNGNWQWISGSGADSQPYFRVFNPWLQSKTHDFSCTYIKKWIPELKDIEPKIIHKWYDKYDEKIYIKPIVNFNEQKKIVLKEYKKLYK